MLTSDLLVTKISKGKIEPIYALLDQDNLEIARSVIGVFQEHVGRTYDELIEELEGIEEINYRLIRGLAQILERRCSIESDAVIDSIAARKTVFEESRGFVTNLEERERVLDKIARKLSIEPDDLEKALWADQEGNLVIKEFQTIAIEDPLRNIIYLWLRLCSSGLREWRFRSRITTSLYSGRSSSWASSTPYKMARSPWKDLFPYSSSLKNMAQPL